MKIAKEASSNIIFHFLILISFICIQILPAQVPGYDLNQWVKYSFVINSTPFFKLLTIQLNHSRLAYTDPNKRIGIGISTNGGNLAGNKDLTFIRGKTGLFPTINGDIWVTPNLRMKGSFMGLSSDGDIAIFTSYGFDLMLNSDDINNRYWLFNFQRGSLEGADDFYIKTIGAGIFRGKTYENGSLWFGIQSDSYNTVVHIKKEDSSIYNKRLKGDVTSIKLGVSRNFGADWEIEMETSLNSSYTTLMFGLHKIIG